MVIEKWRHFRNYNLRIKDMVFYQPRTQAFRCPTPSPDARVEIVAELKLTSSRIFHSLPRVSSRVLFTQLRSALFKAPCYEAMFWVRD
jgi:hypothetical protein